MKFLFCEDTFEASASFISIFELKQGKENNRN